jgi:hypothetical protein
VKTFLRSVNSKIGQVLSSDVWPLPDVVPVSNGAEVAKDTGDVVKADRDSVIGILVVNEGKTLHVSLLRR